MATVDEPRILNRPSEIDYGTRPFRWTADDYEKLAALDMFRDRRVQLINGEIIEMSPMNRDHARCILSSAKILEHAFGAGYHLQSQMPLDLGPSNRPEPDLAVIPGDPRDFREHPSTALLVVEVSESSIRVDLGAKSRVYAEADIADYWVIDLSRRRLVVHHRPEPGPNRPGKFHYAEVTVVPADGFVSPLAKPEARIAVADLLP